MEGRGKHEAHWDGVFGNSAIGIEEIHLRRCGSNV